ncbi:MAG: 2-succinylbenzoate--CoA ligase [Elainellaceae cyanobacterium]
MAEPLVSLQKRAYEQWLLGVDAAQLAEQATQRFQELVHYQQSTDSATSATVLLAESDPLNFLAGFVAACTARSPVFLGNPSWASSEWRSVLAIVQPQIIWGSIANDPEVQELVAVRQNIPSPAQQSQPGSILIPTGGSSGKIRFAIHTWETLLASVTGFKTYFQIDRVHSCCVLPLYHVSGLMQFMRSFTSGGKLAIFSAKIFETKLYTSSKSDQFDFDPSKFFLSLVPTQLHRLLQHPPASEKLAHFRTVLLGGAPAWEELLEQARSAQIRLAPTYGMTETASQVVTLKSEDFLKGQRGCGQVLPHAQIQIQDQAGNPLASGQIGRITIQSQALALGYYPNYFADLDRFATDDLGYFDAQGYLQVVGRSSQKIITGGENVSPAEVEAAIRATQLVQDVCVLGIPDAEWGEMVTAVYVPLNRTPIADLQQALAPRLSKFKQPKRWIAVDAIPRSLQGKINYAQLRDIALRA